MTKQACVVKISEILDSSCHRSLHVTTAVRYLCTWQQLSAVSARDHRCQLSLHVTTAVSYLCKWPQLPAVSARDHSCQLSLRVTTAAICLCTWSQLPAVSARDHSCQLSLHMTTADISLCTWPLHTRHHLTLCARPLVIVHVGIGPECGRDGLLCEVGYDALIHGAHILDGHALHVL